VEALVGAAVLGILALAFAGAYRSNLHARQVVESTTKFVPYVDLLKSYVITKTGQALENMGPPATGCPNFGNVFGIHLTDEVLLDLNARIKRADATDANLVAFTSGAAEHLAARNRCLTNQSFRTSPGFSGQSQIYFCVVMEPAGTATPGSLLAAQPVFAEIFYTLTDIEMGTPVTCENFATTRTRGAHVMYRLYWVDGKGTIFKSWKDSFYGPTPP